MSRRVTTYLTNALMVLGIGLILLGAGMWWRQTRAEAALLEDDRHVLLAVTLDDVDPTLPETADAPAASGGPGLMPVFPQVEEVAAEVASAAPTAAPTEAPTVEPSPQPSPTVVPTAGLSLDPSMLGTAPAMPARIVAPSIGLDANIVEMGWAIRQDASGGVFSEWVVPKDAAGWHKNSALPGQGGNVVLSGHHNVDGEVFRHLVDLEPGAVVALEVNGEMVTYRVEEKYIVKEKGQPLEIRQQNNRFIEPFDEERLTMVTCWPYETNSHRVVVIARPVAPAAVSPALTPPPAN